MASKRTHWKSLYLKTIALVDARGRYAFKDKVFIINRRAAVVPQSYVLIPRLSSIWTHQDEYQLRVDYRGNETYQHREMTPLCLPWPSFRRWFWRRSHVRTSQSREWRYCWMWRGCGRLRKCSRSVFRRPQRGVRSKWSSLLFRLLRLQLRLPSSSVPLTINTITRDKRVSKTTLLVTIFLL